MAYKKVLNLISKFLLHFLLTCILCLLVVSVPLILSDPFNKVTYHNWGYVLLYLVCSIFYGPVIYGPITALFYYLLIRKAKPVSWGGLSFLSGLISVVIYLTVFRYPIFDSIQIGHSYIEEFKVLILCVIWGSIYTILFRLVFSKMFIKPEALAE